MESNPSVLSFCEKEITSLQQTLALVGVVVGEFDAVPHVPEGSSLIHGSHCCSSPLVPPVATSSSLFVVWNPPPMYTPTTLLEWEGSSSHSSFWHRLKFSTSSVHDYHGTLWIESVHWKLDSLQKVACHGRSIPHHIPFCVWISGSKPSSFW